MKKIIAVAVLTIISLHLSAQKGSGNENIRYLFTQGNLMMNEHLSDSSLRTFLQLYKADTQNANVCYFIGQLYLETPAYKYKALPYLQKAAAHITSRYTPDDPYEKDAPAPAYYYYARAQHINYLFNDAIYSFNVFKKMLSKSDPRQKDIDYWINCCSSGIELVKSPVDCKIINMGDSINSKYPDYNPAVSADEQEILFTSRRLGGINDSNSEKDSLGFYNEQMWISYPKTDNSWTKAKTLGNTVNAGGNNATLSVSPDGQELFFVQSETGANNLYVSYLRGMQWSGGQTLDSASPGTINNGTAGRGACISPDGKTLIFSSDRAGGIGGADLYKITISDSGRWSQPVNLGPNINTEYDEDAPFIHADDSTLFFSSKGHNTMGGFDVFMAQMDTGATWGKPTNLGYPINTPDDDAYFNVSPDGRRAYYSTVRKDEIGEKDIYEVIFNVPLPVKHVAVLSGYIRSPDNKPIPNDIIIKTSAVNGHKNVIKARTNPKTGKFLQVLRPNQTYNVVISTQGKNVFNQNFYLPADSSYYSLSRAFFRTGIILGDTTNVFVPKPKTPLDSMTGSILLNDAPLTPLANMQIQLIDEKGNVIQTTLTDKHGHFTFYKLPRNKSYQIKIDLKDTKLKHLKKLLLANSKGKVVRNFDQNTEDSYYYHDLPANLDDLSEISRVAAVAPKIIRISAEDADFVEYFKYNADQNIQKASNFIALINKIRNRLMHDSVTVTIQSSASKVPTSAQYENSNRILAEKRGQSEKTTILNALKKRQANVKKLRFEMNAEVQGPDYAEDAQDQEKYQQYQYVKVFVH